MTSVHVHRPLTRTSYRYNVHRPRRRISSTRITRNGNAVLWLSIVRASVTVHVGRLAGSTSRFEFYFHAPHRTLCAWKSHRYDIPLCTCGGRQPGGLRNRTWNLNAPDRPCGGQVARALYSARRNVFVTLHASARARQTRSSRGRARHGRKRKTRWPLVINSVLRR